MSQTIKAKCIYLNEDYKGMISYHKQNYAVDFLLPQEEAELTLEVKKGKSYFEVKSIDKESPERIDSICPYFKLCGGCQLHHVSYQTQLNWKRDRIQSQADVYKIKVQDCIGMDEPVRYRFKNQMTFSKDKGKVIAGFYQEYTHRVLDIPKCIIQEENVEKIVSTIKQIMMKYKIQPYDEDRRTGYIRHVLVKTSFYSKEIMVTIVISQREFEGKSILIKELRKKHPEISTVIWNVNSRKTSIVLGDEEKNAYGKGYIVDKLKEYTFKISSKSFYQVNPIQTEKLYQTAIEQADLKRNEKVIDAYCGTGTIGIFASSYCKEVIGVELNQDAIRDAINNAKANNIHNIRFIQSDATKWIEAYAKKNETVDVVFMDPPRQGSTPAFLESVLRMNPKKIVYVSCDPNTLFRDLKILTRRYTVECVQPVDMFPYTKHVECVVKLIRNK